MGQQPDVGDGGKSEDDGPDDGEGQDEDSGENPVEPQLGLTEQDERQAPQRIKPVGRVWLSQNVSKVEINFNVNSLLVSGRHVQPSRQSLHTGRTCWLWHLRHLHFLLLLLLLLLLALLLLGRLVLLLLQLHLLLLWGLPGLLSPVI